MKNIVSHPKIGVITYEENFFNGKKTLIINDNVLHQRNETIFVEVDEEKEIEYQVTGNFAAGVTLKAKGVSVQVVPKTPGYEYLIYFFPLILVLIWSSIKELCDVVPLVGGLIGGAISGAISFAALVFAKCKKNLSTKILISLAATAIAFTICALLGMLIVGNV